MKSISFVISRKENESRRALIPQDLVNVCNKDYVFVERGYGDILGYSDDDYADAGATICEREEALTKDIICDPKIGDAEYLGDLKNQTVFGWLHAVQNRDIADKLLRGNLTAFAWEDMYEDGRHCFWRNNEIAGEAAVMHAFLIHGIFPYNAKVAVLGRGNVARGALKTLNFCGAQVAVYDRHTERLFRKEIGEYDVVVNAIIWDIRRKDHIIYKDDLRRMKKGAMIIDVSCDRCGGVETSIPTTIQNPDYVIDGIRHYVVDHTPSLFYKTSTMSISSEVAKYIDVLVEQRNAECEVLHNSMIINNGDIVDMRIKQFQNR